MKTINSLFLSLAALFILSACEDDADKYYLSSLTENELIASTNNIVLTEDIAQKNVLSLAWTDRTLAISQMYDRAVMAMNAVKGNYVQRVSWYDASMK